MDDLELSYIAGALDANPRRVLTYHSRSKSLRLMLPHRTVSRQTEVADILNSVSPILVKSRALVVPALMFIRHRQDLDSWDPRLEALLDGFVAIRDAVAAGQPVPEMPPLGKSPAALRLLAEKQAREAVAPGSWRGQT